MSKSKGRTKRGRLPTEFSHEQKVFVGFWTLPENKKAIQSLSRAKRQSASSYIDELVENHVIAKRRGLRR